MKRKWDMVEDSARRGCVEEIIARIEEIDDEQVGILAAQEIIDIVTKTFGSAIYNAGVRDTKKLYQDRFSDLEVEVDLLEQHS